MCSPGSAKDNIMLAIEEVGFLYGQRLDIQQEGSN